MNKIRLDDGEPLAEMLGFTKKLFDGYIEITDKPNGIQKISVRYVRSLNPGVGNVQRLIQKWIELGFELEVYLPNDTMQHICEKLGFKMSVVDDRFWFLSA